MMTREAVCEEYKVDQYQNVSSPGQFEGEPVFVVAFADEALNGGADSEDEFPDGTLYSDFNVTPEDREQYPELAETAVVRIWQTEQGFWSHELDPEAVDELQDDEAWEGDSDR